MEAILLVDEPSCCYACQLEHLNMCMGVKSNRIIKNLDARPKWCPLRPMPLKRETQVAWQGIGGMKVPTHEPSEYDKGWNDCVEFLKGEENE